MEKTTKKQPNKRTSARKSHKHQLLDYEIEKCNTMTLDTLHTIYNEHAYKIVYNATRGTASIVKSLFHVLVEANNKCLLTVTHDIRGSDCSVCKMRIVICVYSTVLNSFYSNDIKLYNLISIQPFQYSSIIRCRFVLISDSLLHIRVIFHSPFHHLVNLHSYHFHHPSLLHSFIPHLTLFQKFFYHRLLLVGQLHRYFADFEAFFQIAYANRFFILFLYFLFWLCVSFWAYTVHCRNT